ncbi:MULTISPECIES: T9SS type A sorting domain-containing protein [unclassified Lentimicrobium]|uniref:T9SS type A sorting domain-containing protein n=1 Tax=unclassified Lentimicrobium TaxID=2677434 RepID=UPI0015569CC4|nr:MULTISPECIES: T9SS type A sorting domain-containing protein [unclassified Lentimicrobium]NPD48254.1 T9SS type A sorting domain-containing protein [Lentimicrobium sp. S6]NPD83600.1 T9SS type A sorting domain-containing protein [Lentimicrobium sp. L6]
MINIANPNHKLLIYNSLGSIMHEEDIKNIETYIDISDFAFGIYMIKLIHPQKKWIESRKLIID